jgi:hypothetical protein
MAWYLLTSRYLQELATSAALEEDRFRTECGSEHLLELALRRWRSVASTSEKAFKTSLKFHKLYIISNVTTNPYDATYESFLFYNTISDPETV